VPLLPIYTYDQPVLRKKAKPVRKAGDEIIRLVENMFDTMHNANGVGLAANQVGVLHRVVVIDLSEMDETKGFKPLVLVNPEVVSGEGLWTMEEGCLSIPEIKEEVERMESVRLRYQDVDLQDHELDASGFLARVAQHEIDHLNGVLFVDRLNPIKRKLLRGRLNKIRRGDVEVSYPIVSGSDELTEYRKAEAR
jgi:peptide deformylase